MFCTFGARTPTMPEQTIKQNFLEAQAILSAFISDDRNLQNIAAAGSLLVHAINDGKKIISCGNGGSMCDAMHFAEELSGKFRSDRQALPAISISDPSHMSCVGNDYGYDFVFSRFIEGLGMPGDVLLAISSSGNSKNVVLAMQAARKRGMKVIALTGKDGGQMAGISDIEIRAPYAPFADRAQEIHIKVIHSLIHFVELNISAR
jgi:D-sedoheptulose 7-phosphate isomerase